MGVKDGRADRQTANQAKARDRIQESDGRTGQVGGKGFYPPLVESQLPSDDRVDDDDDSWPVIIGWSVSVSKKDTTEE